MDTNVVKTDLLNKIRELTNELNDIEDEERKLRNESLVGKCFRYRNSYGGDSKKWWEYYKVTGVGDWSLIVFNFSEDCNGKIAIVPNYETSILDSSQEIEPEVFNIKLSELLQKISVVSDIAVKGD